jgi:hypothetical protein
MGKVSCNKGKSLSSETKIKMRESRFRFLNNKKINK